MNRSPPDSASSLVRFLQANAEEITAELADVEAASKGNTARQVAREFIGRNGKPGVSVGMIADRLRDGRHARG